MSTSFILIKRNIKLFFKDKGMFFTSLITPGILLILYATFLGNVYRDSFTSGLPDTLNISEKYNRRTCRQSAYIIYSCSFMCDGCFLFEFFDGTG